MFIKVKTKLSNNKKNIKSKTKKYIIFYNDRNIPSFNKKINTIKKNHHYIKKYEE